MTTITEIQPGGDQGFLKQLNRARVLDLVRRHPGLSRAELATHARLTKVTVGTVVADLLQDGWVDEGDLRQGSAGRPGRALYLNEHHHVLLGTEVGVLGIRAVACTLTGRVLASRVVTDLTRTPEDAAARLADLVRALLENPAVIGRSPVGLGVTVPGPVDPADETLLFAPNLNWEDVRFLTLLEPHLPPLPGLRLLDNESNAAAFGEAYWRLGRAPELLAYVSLVTGIGAGLAVGTPTPHLLRGAQGLAGELGHTIIQPGGLYCHCGNRGCAETLLSGWAIRAALGASESEPLEDLVARRLHEPAVQVTLERAGEALGTLLANLHRTLNPSDIVIGGSLTRLKGPLVPTALAFFEAQQRHRLGAPGPVRVEVRTDSQLIPARGAAAQVLARVINAPVAL